jgi:hypothetical protein
LRTRSAPKTASQEEIVPRRQHPSSPDDPALERARQAEREAEPERERPLTRELVEFETGREGSAGEGLRESGTLPGSVGGTTGNSDRAAGPQAPGATAAPLPGIDPEEARQLVGRHRLAARELAEETDTEGRAAAEESPEEGRQTSEAERSRKRNTEG